MYMEPITGGNTQKAVQQMTRVSSQTAAPGTAEPNKTESTDGESSKKQVEIAKGSDESVTLSIMADDQLVDDQKNVNLDRLKKVMEQAIAAMPHSDAKFGFHDKTNRIIIKLVDRETQEVIKEIPPEKTLDLLAKRMELAGVLVDQRL
ncbi:MAG: flagellar protein FlaG [Lachnospiraceae bacterium]|nr:flagellar protein FlaG [Lachnospiraceae bacterium]